MQDPFTDFMDGRVRMIVMTSVYKFDISIKLPYLVEKKPASCPKLIN